MDTQAQKHQDLFIQNVDFFEKYYPKVIQKLNLINHQEPKLTIIFNTFDGERLLNLQILQTEETAYPSNPLTLAKEQAQNALQNDPWVSFNVQEAKKNKNIDKIICMSNGLGYNLIEYNKLYNLKAMLIIEDDIELFKLSLFNVDYEDLCKNKLVDFCIGEDHLTKKQIVLKFYHSLFFYNNSFKLSQVFQTNQMESLISIFEDTLDGTFQNEEINYQEILDDSINTQNFDLLYKTYINDTTNENTYSIESINKGLNLLNYIAKNLELQSDVKLSHNIYYALSLAAKKLEDDKRLHIYFNSINYLKKENELNNLEETLSNKINILLKEAF